MKLYLLVSVFILFLVGLFGFLIPILISAKSTEAVLAGIGTLVFFVPIICYLFIKQIKKAVKPKTRKRRVKK